MTVTIALQHRTSYKFAHPVQVYPHEIRLRPAVHTPMKIRSYTFDVSGGENFINWQQDPFGNYVARLTFPEKMSSLEFTVSIIIDMNPINPFDFFLEEYAKQFGFIYTNELAEDLLPYLTPIVDNEESSPLVHAWIARFRKEHCSSPSETIITLSTLVQEIRNSVDYTLRFESGVQEPEQTLQLASGSCRDSAWLLVAILRALGLAARFVSGYLIQLAPDNNDPNNPSGPLQDFTDLHAWAEVYLPGAGWVGMDATSGLFAGEEHIPLAATPHYRSAAPITGTTGPVQVEFSYSNTVTRLAEDPRTTAPYTGFTWDIICETGAKLDAITSEQGLYLTIGGEPTFVSQFNRDAPEWTTDADGANKRCLAAQFAEKLHKSFAPHGIIHHNQGKWYPGEPMPRWQISLLWRNDGTSLWNNAALFTNPWSSVKRAKRDMSIPKVTEPADAGIKELIIAIAKNLSLPTKTIIPAYEDGLDKLQRHITLPLGDPISDEPDSSTVASRKTIIDYIDQPTDEPVAYILPLSRTEEDDGWQSCYWRTRRGRIVLTPGDSPAGLRLPLNSLSWNPPDPEFPHDPTIDDLPVTDTGTKKEPQEFPDFVPTTALVVQKRGGIVYIFCPPITRLDPWQDLIHAIEKAAHMQGTHIVIEGYGPPADTRLTQLHITPDPGVIEINIHPAHNFAEQKLILETLYDHAYAIKLSAQTYSLDGSEHGTGGGNHITIGATKPLGSPFIQRPHVLSSLVRYFQRHPSLSYLFSGRFIGTTSQAPRCDEGRVESIYELEIALSEIERVSARRNPPDPWVCDRALRYLLTDITGNTHRAEICIDKLYPGDNPNRRLGLVELRGFEMPPHFQMALVQNLLIRSLLSWFWDAPYREPLIRFGEDLHGKYLLPYYLLNDMNTIVYDLKNAGYSFENSWIDPFFYFRFPIIGTSMVNGVTIELRSAIEPWNTLGEESTAQGTARYVDSSLERLQIHVKDFDPTRFILVCNSFPIPLIPTHHSDEYIAGIRYRAWQPPSSLHPTITIDTPLTFDLIDITQSLSLGGIRYHAIHPGGRSYEKIPVNESEAGSRRINRFTDIGFTPGKWNMSKLKNYQLHAQLDTGPQGILDLRRARTVWKK